MEITVLIENTTDSELICEHGLSLFIEFNGNKYLLDSGQSGSFMDNAKLLGIDVSQAECAILSHGHYDHAGGFGRFFEEISDMKIYAMNSAMEEYYSASGGMHSIGIPKEILNKYSDRFIKVDRITCIGEGIWLIPHTTKGLSSIGSRAGLYRRIGEEIIPDDFSHEMSLVFDTDKGLVIFNSCSHAGLCNIIHEVKSALPDKKIHAFLGGLHMKGMKDGVEYCTFSEMEIEEIAEFLKAEGVEYIYTGHCTGCVGAGLLEKVCQFTKVHRITTGGKYTI